MSSLYKQQQGFDSFQSAEQLQDIISKLIKKEVKNEIRKQLRFMESCKILSINGNKADIGFADSDTVIQNVKINDGLNLSVNDEAYVLLINFSPSNLLIIAKKG